MKGIVSRDEYFFKRCRGYKSYQYSVRYLLSVHTLMVWRFFEDWLTEKSKLKILLG